MQALPAGLTVDDNNKIGMLVFDECGIKSKGNLEEEFSIGFLNGILLKVRIADQYVTCKQQVLAVQNNLSNSAF